MPETDSSFLLNLHRGDQVFRVGLCLSDISGHALSQRESHFLNAQERQRWQSFKHRKRADDYLCGRYSAKRAVAALYPDQLATEIKIDSGVFHQPLMFCPDDPSLRVSLSHTPTVSAAVVFPAAHPMAVDVEATDPGNEAELKAQLTRSEVAMQADLTIFSELETITGMWTIKEALSKVLGSGLTAPVRLYEVSDVEPQSGLLIARFRHFIQYKALCFRWGRAMCSLVLPERSRLAEADELVSAGQRIALTNR